tara:strand:+ start:149 stop:271 length:123 start_codon:yes stop_codon:yes gene_type:complete
MTIFELLKDSNPKESEKIIECFETYAQRENFADICIRTWN